MHIWKYLFGGLSLLLVLVWVSVASFPDNNLHLIACDVGQGDAVLAIYKDTQVLIDGGPRKRVLDCLSNYIPFWDRQIEVVILSHSQEDHFGGLIEVFRRYQVDTFLTSGLDSSSKEFQVLKSLVGGSGARVVNVTTGMDMRIGMIHLDMVYPSSQFLAVHATLNENANVLGAYTSNDDPNDFSVVANLSFNRFDALFTGDIRPEVIDEVIGTNKLKDVEYIKIPHHGSKNGLTQELLQITKPELAVISVGKNSWGHPHKEVLEMLEKAYVKVLRTDQEGDIEVITDGEEFWLKE